MTVGTTRGHVHTERDQGHFLLSFQLPRVRMVEAIPAALPMSQPWKGLMNMWKVTPVDIHKGGM